MYNPNEIDGVKIIRKPESKNVEKPLNVFNPTKQVRFICKECEMTIFVKYYDDIIKMGKMCNTCRKENPDEIKIMKQEKMKEHYLSRNAVICNNCHHKDTRNKCAVGASLRCPKCESYDVYETNPKPNKKGKNK